LIQAWRSNPGGAGLLRGEGILFPLEEVVAKLRLDSRAPEMEQKFESRPESN